MPANTSPIFSLTPNVGQALLSAANTKSDGSGTVATDMFKVFTAGSNGSLVSKARITVGASAAGTSSTATVVRLYYSTVSSGTTANTDTKLLVEVAVPSVTADSATVPTSAIDVPLNFAIPTGSYIHASSHAGPAANTSYELTCFGGDF